MNRIIKRYWILKACGENAADSPVSSSEVVFTDEMISEKIAKIYFN